MAGEERISPEKIMRLASGPWALKTLTVAIELSIFTVLNDSSKTLEELSSLLKLRPRPLERLLNANAALGFLIKAQKSYSNADVAATYLVEGKPSYLGDFVKLNGIYGYNKWADLKRSITEDSPIEDTDEDFRNNEERMQYFTRAMHNNAMGPAKFLLSLVNFDKYSRLVDLGGGSGVYCTTLLQEYPNLTASLIELPAVAKVSREYVQDSPTKDRIEIIEADMLSNEIDIKADVVLVSQVLHGMSRSDCKRLVNKCYELSDSGGLIIIHEFVLDDDKAGPLYPALFSLNMLVSFKDGDAYTKADLTEWLEIAGYKDISFHNTPGPSTFIIAHKG